jgi:hypothetical protein
VQYSLPSERTALAPKCRVLDGVIKRGPRSSVVELSSTGPAGERYRRDLLEGPERGAWSFEVYSAYGYCLLYISAPDGGWPSAYRVGRCRHMNKRELRVR